MQLMITFRSNYL